jgi:hypothetical protein
MNKKGIRTIQEVALGFSTTAHPTAVAKFDSRSRIISFFRVKSISSPPHNRLSAAKVGIETLN